MKHWTTWQNGGAVGVECPARPPASGATWTLSVEDGGAVCPHCGVTVRLVWDVRVETTTGGRR